MSTQLNNSTVQDGLSVKAYRGDGSILLAFDLDETLTPGLAGFAIQCTPPNRPAFYLSNRLGFHSGTTTATTPEQRTWIPSIQAPFQKFSWVEFPSEIQPGLYCYTITAMYFGPDGGLKTGPSADVSFELTPLHEGPLSVGFTRGYMSSQAYAQKFHNAEIRPQKSLDYDTKPYQAQYEWLGYRARQLVFDFMQECLADPTVTVDMFAYDLDEPDFIHDLQQLGSRLRAVLDDAPLHTKTGALEIQAKSRLVASAGALNVKTGHFKRFAHDKVLIMKKNGQAVKVLTGSANFSIRGLYVQANNILVFDDPATAALYEQAFNNSFADMPGFEKSAIASQWYDFENPILGSYSACFSPHKSALVSLNKVATAIQNAHSSVLFAVMELDGSGPVMDELKQLGNRTDIFSYGITQAAKGLNLYKPGETHAILTSFSYLKKKVPQPFRSEWSGGLGQVIHHKFVVVDFNDQHPVVFCGSSNLSAGGEQDNGDNLLAIYDPQIVAAYAVEAIRLVDHYHFRAAMQSASQVKPLQLQSADAVNKWWQPYYDKTNIRYFERSLLCR
jgi:phosphatidylserine/phosphatidylglycerophosphate/cardiolipin synthase-like enzyme